VSVVGFGGVVFVGVEDVFGVVVVFLLWVVYFVGGVDLVGV